MNTRYSVIHRMLLATVVMAVILSIAIWALRIQAEENNMKQNESVQASGGSDNRWHRPSDEEIREKLTTEQYRITQKDGTEPPFQNAYWDNHQVGLYVDIVSGEPLFSSVEKFDSGTGWPSFYAPIDPENLVEKTDWSWGMRRVEIRSKHANSHLGHVFKDGPKPTGLRYCINSASLRFIPVEDLEKEGYGEYVDWFKK